MKLSAGKKRGFLHVKGTSLVKVVHGHLISMDGLSAPAPYAVAKNDPRDSLNWVRCEPGDLAIEVRPAKQKRGKAQATVGYSFLTGGAIQLMGYESEPSSFEPASLAFVAMPLYDGSPASREAIMQLLHEARASKPDMVVFDYEASSAQYADAATVAFPALWDMAEGPSAHFLGRVLGSGRGEILLHRQPPEHAADATINGFQLALILALAKWKGERFPRTN